eukprot:TRINITY_DN585_c7_g1_i1.p2 TRINITY_DN585_c7_g1~~TRINITY_DN585_c7_g1_i1.p2  ORF type:complete len:181 (+),score=34.06 TRINITY_DN585_c7_g1_i1:223-765(+)
MTERVRIGRLAAADCNALLSLLMAVSDRHGDARYTAVAQAAARPPRANRLFSEELRRRMMQKQRRASRVPPPAHPPVSPPTLPLPSPPASPRGPAVNRDVFQDRPVVDHDLFQGGYVSVRRRMKRHKLLAMRRVPDSLQPLDAEAMDITAFSPSEAPSRTSSLYHRRMQPPMPPLVRAPS